MIYGSNWSVEAVVACPIELPLWPKSGSSFVGVIDYLGLIAVNRRIPVTDFPRPVATGGLRGFWIPAFAGMTVEAEVRKFSMIAPMRPISRRSAGTDLPPLPMSAPDQVEGKR